jgi:hypothetical protein
MKLLLKLLAAAMRNCRLWATRWHGADGPVGRARDRWVEDREGVRRGAAGRLGGGRPGLRGERMTAVEVDQPEVDQLPAAYPHLREPLAAVD